MCKKYAFIHADQITVLPRQRTYKHHICAWNTLFDKLNCCCGNWYLSSFAI